MEKATIEELAYIIKQAKKNNQPMPIFFLGAGASKTGNIPLAQDIVKDILEKYSDSPKIKKLPKEDQTYSNLMDCLLPAQRHSLLKEYIDKGKINVTHLYIAQLMKAGFIDYVLTVNFDNLMLRALALLNEFPPTYDMAILKDLTTTGFNEKSVFFLHGQHHGVWLLNTEEEMKKVANRVPRIFERITSKRPWVFIGYSGNDPVFNHIKDLGRFDNGLFWVAYKDNDPDENVVAFLKRENTNASIIKGYDSDSFILELNTKLNGKQPEIIDKPFSSLKEMLENIVDVDDEKHFKGVRERVEIVKNQVEDAVNRFEKGYKVSNGDINAKNEIDILKKKIINLILNKEYKEDEISKIEEKAESINDESLNESLSDFYFNWGNSSYHLAGLKKGEEAEVLFMEACKKYEKAIELKPDADGAFYNWGLSLYHLASLKKGEEAEELFIESCKKYEKAIELKPDADGAFYNLGISLAGLARLKEGEEAEFFFIESCKKYERATELKPDKDEAFNNWGISLADLAGLKKGEEAESFFMEACKKYEKAIELKPDADDAYNNWGNSLEDLAGLKKGEEAEAFFREAFKKYEKAIELNSKLHEAFNNWSNSLIFLARLKKGEEAEEILEEAFEKAKKAEELGGLSYNLSCVYSLKKDKENALKYLEKSLENSQIKISHIENDKDWEFYRKDDDFILLLDKYR